MDRKGNSHRSDKRAAPAPAAKGAERVAKVIARAGLCSRREAEAWITEGRVAVNGAAIASPALNIGPRDAVAVEQRAERQPGEAHPQVGEEGAPGEPAATVGGVRRRWHGFLLPKGSRQQMTVDST